LHFHFHHLGWIALPLTQLGNPLLIALLSCIFALWLAWASGRQAVQLWLAIAILTAALMAVLKIYFLGCPLETWALRSPSGHTGFSALLYGAIAYSAARGTSPLRKTVIAILAALLIVGIGLSRYLLQMHSLPEVGLGLALGGIALLTFCWRYARLAQKRFRLWRALILAALLAIPLRMLVKPITFEMRLLGIAERLSLHASLCATTTTE